MKVQGALTKPASVTVNGVPARVDANNQFEGSAAVKSGSNQFEVAATDGNGNTATQRYQVNVPAAASVTQEYDFNGNLTRKTEGTAPTTYEWDAANRLAAINVNTQRSEFEYDGLSRRVHIVEKESGAVISEKRFIWSGLTLAEERDGSGGNVTKRFFSQGVQIASGSGVGNYFYAKDHLGSIRELTDTTSSIRARYDYDPFGRRSKVGGDMDADFGFTGHYAHQASGLVFAPLRAYDPNTAKWLSRDPLENAELSQGPNLYAYVGNNPLRYGDPLGLYGYETKYWADLSVNGNVAQRAIAWPLGIIATILTPDTVGLTGSGTAGILAGGTAGVDRQYFRGASCPADFSFLGHSFDSDGASGFEHFVSPQLSVAFQVNFGWSGDYNPTASSWAGDFKETSSSAGPIAATYFQAGSWRGFGIGVTAGPAPVSASNLTVTYTPRP